MVKGVNKNIIEVNDTNNEFFEKIVFYLSPKYTDLDVKSKEKAFNEVKKVFLEQNYTEKIKSKKIKFFNKKKTVLLCCIGISLLIGLGVGLYFFSK